MLMMLTGPKALNRSVCGVLIDPTLVGWYRPTCAPIKEADLVIPSAAPAVISLARASPCNRILCYKNVVMRSTLHRNGFILLRELDSHVSTLELARQIGSVLEIEKLLPASGIP